MRTLNNTEWGGGDGSLSRPDTGNFCKTIVLNEAIIPSAGPYIVLCKITRVAIGDSFIHEP